MANLNDLAIRALKPPAKGQISVADGQIHGLSLRISQGGAKTFSLVYGNPRKRVTLGRYPIITLAQAREKARKLLAHRMLHGDAPPDLTFEEAMTLFLKIHCAEHNRPSTARETERLLRRHFLPRLGDRTLKDISTQDILRITDRMLATPSEANNAHAAVRTLFRWATRRRYLPHSPMEGLTAPARKQPRSRTLSPLNFAQRSPTGSILAFTGRSSGCSCSRGNVWASSDTSGVSLSNRTRSHGLRRA